MNSGYTEVSGMQNTLTHMNLDLKILLDFDLQRSEWRVGFQGPNFNKCELLSKNTELGTCFREWLTGQIKNSLPYESLDKMYKKILADKDKEIHRLKKELEELGKFKSYYRLQYLMQNGEEINSIND